MFRNNLSTRFLCSLTLVIVCSYGQLLNGILGSEEGHFHVVPPGGWNYDLSTGSSCSGTVESKCGPVYCGKVTEPNAINSCNGEYQTPININSGDVKVSKSSTRSLVINTPALLGGCHIWTQFVDDHAFEVSFSEADEQCKDLNVTFKGTSYTMKQLHFHATSEHTVDNKVFDAELHMVHKSADGKLLVLGVLISTEGLGIRGNINDRLLKIFFTAASKKAQGLKFVGGVKAEDVVYEWNINSLLPINPYNDFLPLSKSYYTYSGFLTTYPCTEGVTWVLFKDYLVMTPQDVKILKDAVKLFPTTIVGDTGNYRPTQPLNNRVVTLEH